MDNEEGVTIPLRLHVHKERNQVLFAEANSDFVDTLFSFLTLPIGKIVKILQNQCDLQPGDIGSFRTLYESVANLDVSHFWSEECKEKFLLNPRNAAAAQCQRLKINIDDTGTTTYFVCPNFKCTIPEISLYSPEAKCSCEELLNKAITIKPDENTEQSNGKGGAFVTEIASFIVCDDLHVIPNLPTTVFKLFEKFGISNLNAVDEINLNIGFKEMLNLLKWSLQSNSPMTDTFIKNKLNSPGLVKQSLLKSGVGNSSENRMGKLDETTERTMTINLVIQKSNNKVLFAHAEENFVDFLFSLLTIPLGGVAHLLNGNFSVGSVGNLYNSLSTLSLERHLKSQNLKSMLVNPQLAALHLSKNLIFSFSEEAPHFYLYTKTETYYNGSYYQKRILELMPKKVNCSTNETCVQMLLNDPKLNEGEFTRPSMFVVTDDLVVSPLSTFSVASYLRKSNVQLSDVKEEVISIGLVEAQKILKAAFESTSVFTNAGFNIMPKNIKQEQT